MKLAALVLLHLPLAALSAADQGRSAGVQTDASTITFQDLTVGSNGYLQASAGDVYSVGGSFLNASTQALLWSTSQAEISFRAGGSGTHSFTFAGADVGPSYFGFQTNYVWATLRVAPGQSLTLGDGNATPGAAFYVGRVILEGGIGQAASITGNGCSIFYDPSDAANIPLRAGAPGGIYNLAGGGVLAPVQAVLAITNATRLNPTTFRLTGLAVPLRTNTIEASTDLNTWTGIGTVVPNAAGAFTFDDLNAGSFPKRFYRVSFAVPNA